MASMFLDDFASNSVTPATNGGGSLGLIGGYGDEFGHILRGGRKPTTITELSEMVELQHENHRSEQQQQQRQRDEGNHSDSSLVNDDEDDVNHQHHKSQR